MTNYSKDLRFRMPVEQNRKNRGGKRIRTLLFKTA